MENDLSQHSPSPAATWILERVLPERDREAVLGDLIEEYELRAQSTTPWMVSRWYWGQVCRSIPRITCGSVNRGRWLPTLGVAVGAYIAAGALEFAETVALSKLLTPDAPVFTAISLVVVNYGKLPDQPESVLARWNSTEVYGRIDGRWKIIHSHWSYMQSQPKPPSA